MQFSYVYFVSQKMKPQIWQKNSQCPDTVLLAGLSICWEKHSCLYQACCEPPPHSEKGIGAGLQCSLVWFGRCLAGKPIHHVWQGSRPGSDMGRQFSDQWRCCLQAGRICRHAILILLSLLNTTDKNHYASQSAINVYTPCILLQLFAHNSTMQISPLLFPVKYPCAWSHALPNSRSPFVHGLPSRDYGRAEKSKGRQVSAAFIYLRPRDKTIQLMQAWAGKLNGSSYVDETKAFNDLLGSQPFSNLTIGVLPSAVFPTADEMTKNTNPRLKVNLCFVKDFAFSASSRKTQAAAGFWWRTGIQLEECKIAWCNMSNLSALEWSGFSCEAMPSGSGVALAASICFSAETLQMYTFSSLVKNLSLHI